MAFFSRSINHRFLTLFGVVGVLVLAAVVLGYRGISASVEELRRVAAQDVNHERVVSSMVSAFKKQVQEWKNVLLRGSDPQQLNKYWGKFQKQEEQIQASGQSLLVGMPPSEARRKVEEFLTAHREMGVAYRRIVRINALFPDLPSILSSSANW